MAATILSAPSSVHFIPAANFGIATNQVNASFATIDIVFTINATGPAIGNTLTLGYAAKNLAFSFVATPSSQMQLPAAQNGIDDAYIADFIEYLQRNTDILSDFALSLITTSASIKHIRLTARKVGKLDINNCGTSATGVSITFVEPTFSGIYKQKNLKSKVFVLNNSGIIPLSGRYTAANFGYTNGGIVTYSVGDLLQVSPYIPSPYDDDYGYANENITEYHIRYADAYGEPEVVEPLMRSEYFTALWGETTNFQLVENQFRQLHAENFAANIAWGQRAFLFVFNETTRDIQMAVNVHFINGTSTLYNVLNPISVQGNRVFYFRTDTDFIDLKNTLEALSLDPKNVIGYEFQLRNTSGARLAGRDFILKDCEHAHEELWFVNEWGGIETVQLECTQSLETETTTATSIDDAIFVNDKKSRGTVTFKTPPLSMPEVLHIKRLIKSKFTFMLSRDKQSLTALVLDSKNLATANIRDWATEPQTLIFKKVLVE